PLGGATTRTRYTTSKSNSDSTPSMLPASSSISFIIRSPVASGYFQEKMCAPTMAMLQNSRVVIVTVHATVTASPALDSRDFASLRRVVRFLDLEAMAVRALPKVNAKCIRSHGPMNSRQSRGAPFLFAYLGIVSYLSVGGTIR